MTFQRGMDGALVIGGILDGATDINGALSAGAAAMNIDQNGVGALNGVVLAGDTFTIAGETGAPVHTVTGGPYPAAANAIAGIAFTPVIAAGGVADNAVVTFASNSVAQAKMWGLQSQTATLETTSFGDKARGRIPGLVTYTGKGQASLDYTDPRQARLVDRIASAAPASASASLVARVASKKQLYGGAVLRELSIVAQFGALVMVDFSWESDGAFLVDWH